MTRQEAPGINLTDYVDMKIPRLSETLLRSWYFELLLPGSRIKRFVSEQHRTPENIYIVLQPPCLQGSDFHYYH
jgi:hypothetical protein